MNVAFLLEPARRVTMVIQVREGILDLLVIKATKVLEGLLDLLDLLDLRDLLDLLNRLELFVINLLRKLEIK